MSVLKIRRFGSSKLSIGLAIFFSLIIGSITYFGQESMEKGWAQQQGRLVDQSDALVYVPAGLAQGQKVPAIFAFSPGADANGLMQMWRPVADRRHWVVYASKEYRNNLDVLPFLARTKGKLDQALAQYPIDRSRVIFTGMSGGGSFSQVMNLQYPGMASALIVNTGRIWEPFGAVAEASGVKFGDSRRLAVFLASPTDFRYQEMKRDYALLVKLGWTVKWIEFQGGHVYAPPEKYEEALQWLQSNPKWAQ